jgi:hypothetical protein
MIEAALQPLRSHKLWPWQRCGIVVRTINHTKSWIASYITTESNELDHGFVDDNRYYTIHILTYGNAEIRFVFRLRTHGLEGWTEYGIGVVRVGEYFACQE